MGEFLLMLNVDNLLIIPDAVSNLVKYSDSNPE